MTALSIPRPQFQAHPFHMVESSPWPMLTGNAVLTMLVSFVLWVNGIQYGSELLGLGFLSVVFAFTLWFRDVTIEGTYLGDHTLIVQKGLTMGVSLFIVTEAFFFVSIFWASAIAPFN